MKKMILIILCLGMFLVGLLTSQVFQIEKANAAKTIEYRVIQDHGHGNDTKEFENILNANAKQGWKLHSYASGNDVFIFER